MLELALLTQMLPTHPVSGHCFPLTVQPATHHGTPSKAEVGNLPCQLTHYRFPADYTFPLPENNSKQIKHSISLGQLPQTVKASNKNTGWEVWPDEKSLPLLVHFYIHQKLFSQALGMLNMRYLTVYIFYFEYLNATVVIRKSFFL